MLEALSSTPCDWFLVEIFQAYFLDCLPAGTDSLSNKDSNSKWRRTNLHFDQSIQEQKLSLRLHLPRDAGVSVPGTGGGVKGEASCVARDLNSGVKAARTCVFVRTLSSSGL